MSADPSDTTMTRTDVVVDGARVAVFELGDGEPCLLLHGYPQDHRCWRRVAPDLAQTHRIIAPDWFGWGRSERSLTLAPRFDAEVERLDRLLDELGLRQVNLFGHDYGGLLALGLARRSPSRIRRLALINTRAHCAIAEPWSSILATMTWFARVPGLHSALTRMPNAWIHARWLERYVAKGCFTRDEVESYVGWMREPGGRRWLAHFYRHFRVDARSELAAGPPVNVPIAAIWGDRDRYFPYSIAVDLARAFPRAEVTRVVGADHYVLEERPAEVVAALRALLART